MFNSLNTILIITIVVLIICLVILSSSWLFLKHKVKSSDVEIRSRDNINEILRSTLKDLQSTLEDYRVQVNSLLAINSTFKRKIEEGLPKHYEEDLYEAKKVIIWNKIGVDSFMLNKGRTAAFWAKHFNIDEPVFIQYREKYGFEKTRSRAIPYSSNNQS